MCINDERDRKKCRPLQNSTAPAMDSGQVAQAGLMILLDSTSLPDKLEGEIFKKSIAS